MNYVLKVFIIYLMSKCQSECSNFDIVVLTESWLDTSIENDTISMKSVHPLRENTDNMSIMVLLYMLKNRYTIKDVQTLNRVTWSAYGSK